MTDLQAALGRELLPVLTDVARAWTEMTRTATGAPIALDQPLRC